MLFVFFPPGCSSAQVALGPELFPGGQAAELFTGERLPVSVAADGRRVMVLKPGRCQIAVCTDAPCTWVASPKGGMGEGSAAENAASSVFCSFIVPLYPARA